MITWGFHMAHIVFLILIDETRLSDDLLFVIFLMAQILPFDWRIRKDD